MTKVSCGIYKRHIKDLYGLYPKFYLLITIDIKFNNLLSTILEGLRGMHGEGGAIYLDDPVLQISGTKHSIVVSSC